MSAKRNQRDMNQVPESVWPEGQHRDNIMTTQHNAPTCTERPLELPVPLWIVGPRRPVNSERRKDPGDLGRHVQALTGTPSAVCLRRRNTDKQPTLMLHLISLWQER